MGALIAAVAEFSSLRDREALNFALVQLLAQFAPEPLDAIRLLLCVGEPGEQRWQCLAKLLEGDSQPTRDKVWTDFSVLPRLGDYPDRQQCMATGDLVHSGTEPSVLLIPVPSASPINCVLELQSVQALHADTVALIQSLLKIYCNVLGLLDYSERDSLTELLNRKTFDGAFIAATQMDKLQPPRQHSDRRAHRPNAYWLAVMDIDHFKRVNDTHGHLIGDEVLVLMARLMRQNFRYNDQLYRFGGEEFVVLMRCADASDAHTALERFRTMVESRDFPQVGQITISIGYAPLVSDDTPGAAFERADKAVYFAKSNGRNQVCSFPDLVAQGAVADQVNNDDQVDFF